MGTADHSSCDALIEHSVKGKNEPDSRVCCIMKILYGIDQTVLAIIPNNTTH